MIYLGVGEKEKALDWLDKSYQDQESACWYLTVDPIYDSVRKEPRFQAILKKIGLESQLPSLRWKEIPDQPSLPRT